jgi:hypothetical protein
VKACTSLAKSISEGAKIRESNSKQCTAYNNERQTANGKRQTANGKILELRTETMIDEVVSLY